MGKGKWGKRNTLFLTYLKLIVNPNSEKGGKVRNEEGF
jgi:hypothetical protein